MQTTERGKLADERLLSRSSRGSVVCHGEETDLGGWGRAVRPRGPPSSHSLRGAACHFCGKWSEGDAQRWLLSLALHAEFSGVFVSFHKYISVNREDRWQETRLLLLFFFAEIEFGFEDEGPSGFISDSVLAEETGDESSVPASSGSGLVTLLSGPQLPDLERKGLCQAAPRGSPGLNVSASLLCGGQRGGSGWV